jgi:hypothetical protein
MILDFTGLDTGWSDDMIGSAEQPASVSGYYRGIFEDTQSPVSTGFYRFDFDISTDSSWLAGTNNLPASSFLALPEPATLALLPLAGMLAMRRRKAS